MNYRLGNDEDSTGSESVEEEADPAAEWWNVAESGAGCDAAAVVARLHGLSVDDGL